MHPPDKRSRQAQSANARNCIGNRAAGRLHAVLHRAIKHFAAFPFDQLHNAFFDPHEVKEAVISVRDHIDDSVADADHFILSHRFLSS